MKVSSDIAVADADTASRRIDLDVLVGDGPAASRSPHGLRDCAATKQRADAREELANAERFRQVVVGAAVEAEHLVGLFAPGGQHQDRRVGVR